MKDDIQSAFSYWFFRNPDILTAEGTQRPWNQKKLVNKLNHLNFTDSLAHLVCRHKESNKFILIKAYPQPCVKDVLSCRLNLNEKIADFQNKFTVEFLMIDDGLVAVIAQTELIGMEEDLCTIKLPDQARLIQTRKTRRYYCRDVACELSQNGLRRKGALIDFTPMAMSVSISEAQGLSGFDMNQNIHIDLSNEQDNIFSGPCICIRNGMDMPDGRVVFSPTQTKMERFPKRKMRNPRYRITPAFVIRFKHPLFSHNIERDIYDISTSGFSIIDDLTDEILLPGMKIDNVSIIYAGIITINCSVQVLYRHDNEINNMLQCGLTISKIDIDSFTYLNHILSIHIDGNARVSTNVDMDALWEFFFDTGFIYGEKYKHIHPYRKIFKHTYAKLYQNNPSIARHFVYEKNGMIYGHIAMVHAYTPSWLIHHFTARRMGNRLPGPSVLKEIIHYTGSYNRLPLAGMDHVMTYYQPNNRIIDRIFGAFTREINNPQISSVDTFSYILFDNKSKQALSHAWKFKKCSPDDYDSLTAFYDSCSGGLFLDAFRIDIPSDLIKNNFNDAGFKRDYQCFCLTYKDKPCAYFIVNQSDLGLNLSDLLNGIIIVVIEPADLPWPIIIAAVNNLSHYFSEEKIPLLIFPANYLASQNIAEEKKYALWILQAIKGSDDFLKYTDSLIRIQ